MDVPGHVLAHAEVGAFARERNQRRRVLSRHVDPLEGGRRIDALAAFDERARLSEDPGVSLSAARNHHGIDARAFQHRHHVIRREDVAAPDHRDADRALHLGDRLPVRGAAVELLAGPPVHRDGRGPGGFHRARELLGVGGRVVPPLAELHRDRHRYRSRHRRHDRRPPERRGAHARPALPSGLAPRGAPPQVDGEGVAGVPYPAQPPGPAPASPPAPRPDPPRARGPPGGQGGQGGRAAPPGLGGTPARPISV